MMNLIYLLIIISFLFSNEGLIAQDNALQRYMLKNIISLEQNSIPEELLQQSNIFFSKLIRNQIDSAYDALLKDSPLANKKEQISKLKTETYRSIELYGAMTGYEIVRSELVSSSLLKISYIALHTRYPMRWMITFYKSKELGWIIINIKFDDNVEFFFSDE